MTEKHLKTLHDNYSIDIKADDELRQRVTNLEIKIMTKKDPSLLSSKSNYNNRKS